MHITQHKAPSQLYIEDFASALKKSSLCIFNHALYIYIHLHSVCQHTEEYSQLYIGKVLYKLFDFQHGSNFRKYCSCILFQAMHLQVICGLFSGITVTSAVWRRIFRSRKGKMKTQ